MPNQNGHTRSIAAPRMNAGGALYALGATLLWSGNFIVARTLNDQMPPVAMAMLRWLLASAMILPFCYGGLRRDWPAIKAHFRYYLSATLTGATLFAALLYTAAHTTAALNLTLIATSSPILTIIMARILFKEALSPQRIAGIILTLAGVLFLAVRGDFSALLSLGFHKGDLLMLAASMLFAVYTIQLRFRPAGASSSSFFTLMFLMALATSLPLAAAEYALTPDYHINFSPKVALCLLYLALMPTIISFFWWNRSVLSIGPGNASLIYYSLPLFSGLLGWLLLHEDVNRVHLMSGAMILCGILLATRLRNGIK
ncbi:MAG: DMT family transporter [Deltaproteobacteria bacterium]|jgi:drug/metabolite transporter (DMT)-like permease|nr:DMT family transporter [Deltaproteobacteria bacterium]